MSKNLTLFKILTLFIVIICIGLNSGWSLEGKCKPIRLANGRTKLRRQGRLVRFRCFKGYEFVGRRYMNCFQGHWDFERDKSVNFPMCVKPGCQASSYVNGHFLETYKGAVVSVVCSLGYTLHGPSTVYCNGTRWNQPFPECKASDPKPPKSCDFEDNLCGWMQESDGDWLWRKKEEGGSGNETISAAPPYDGSNPGQYMLLGNSSSRIENATEKLFSPVFPPDYANNSCFTFWYLLHGRTAGYLKVFVKEEGAELYNSIPPFWVTGDQSGKWLPGYFPLYQTSEPFQIVFQGMSLPGNESETAFDDVKILSGIDCDNFRQYYAAHLAPTTTTVEPTDDDYDAFSCINRCGDYLPGTGCGCLEDCLKDESCCSDYEKFCVKSVTSTLLETVSSTSVATIFDITTGSSTDRTSTVSEVVINTTAVSEMTSFEKKTQNISTSEGSTVLNISQKSVTNTQKTTKDFPTSKIFTKATTTKPVRFETNTTNRTTVKLVQKINTASVPVPRRRTNHLNLQLHIDPSLSIHMTKSRLQKMAEDKTHGTGENSLQLMKSEDNESASTSKTFPAGAVEALAAVAAVLVCTIVAIILIRRRRRRKTKEETLVEDSDVRYLTSDEFLDFTLARPADDDL